MNNEFLNFAINLDKNKEVHSTSTQIIIELSKKIKELEARITQLEKK